MRVLTLERCPECDEPLAPERERARCRVCESAYDGFIALFRPRRPGLVYLPVGMSLVFAPSIYRFTDTFLNGATPALHTVLFASMALALVIWMAPRRRCLAFGGRRYVVLGDFGLQARTTRGLQRIPWSDVAGLAVMFGVPILLRHEAGRECRLEWIFDSDAEVAEFRAALSRGKNTPNFAAPSNR